MPEYSFSAQYLRHVRSSLLREGHDIVLTDAECRFIQTCFDATMTSASCASCLLLNRTVTELERLAGLPSGCSKSASPKPLRRGRRQASSAALA
jgi:hypothetical protein